MKTYIYSLICPIDNKVKYIGKANDPKARFRKHKSLANNDKGENYLKNEWVRTLYEKGLIPILEIIEQVDVSDWKVKEKYYISLYKQMGIELYNICGGGNGATFGNKGSFKGNPPVKVICLSKKGEYIKTFDSIKQGEEFCGKRIHNVLVGKRKTSGGYIWVYEKVYKNYNKEQLQDLIKESNINNSSKNGLKTRFTKNTSPWNKGKSGFISIKRKKVVQYTVGDDFVKIWDSAKIASKELGCTDNNIKQCIYGKTKTAVGYKWKYLDLES
jgi:hypothetical protein